MILNRKQVEKEITNYSFIEDFIKYNLKFDENLDIEDLKKTIKQASKFSKFETEMSRREFIVSPILFKLSYLIDIQIHSEENIYYSENLRGKLLKLKIMI